MIEVVIDDEVRHAPYRKQALKKAAQAALVVAGMDAPRSLTIRICSDATVQALNAQFRGKDRPTNVLSFPFGDERYLGDIALAHPFLAHEAERLGLSAEAHAQHLVIHGVLHLLGYDHIRNDEARAMQALEQAAMRALGLHDPYPDEEG